MKEKAQQNSGMNREQLGQFLSALGVHNFDDLDLGDGPFSFGDVQILVSELGIKVIYFFQPSK